MKFRPLFNIYTRVSNKLVGVLLRARKYGLVEFDGEMLFQGRDDSVQIRLSDAGVARLADGCKVKMFDLQF